MSGTLARRLGAIERELAPVKRVVCVVVDQASGETLADALAKRFPDGVPPSVSPLGITTGVPRNTDLVIVELTDADGGTHAFTD
ncbi:hypothetical protein GXW71_28215 [Roseomonas hellenica]|uniref:Uncharacterized protein n=1 Tax=Plastoroseomonas hellenica TaxID=2687306 RepID=A0ABS5F6T0_9PROT|nr:hypothetical protein [Plastoroseomonas hellenica]MBR0668270.1 hypothetical protein [Plastoroseomonas hellenica]